MFLGGRFPERPGSTASQTGVRKEKGRLDSAGGGGGWHQHDVRLSDGGRVCFKRHGVHGVPAQS